VKEGRAVTCAESVLRRQAGTAARFEGKSNGEAGCTEQPASGILLGRQTTRPGSILYLMLCGSLARTHTCSPRLARCGLALLARSLASDQLHTTRPRS
jgi:hypothetical protein